MSDKLTIRFRIYGFVQGVGFRYFAYRNAQLTGISGYVKNRSDGSVEVIAQGTGKNLSEYEILLKQGPSKGRVEEIIREEIPRDEIYYGFEII